MSEILIKEQHTVELDGRKFLITALGASAGLETMSKVMGNEGALSDPLFMRKLITNSVTVDNVAIDDKKYELLFSRKLDVLIKLFEEILQFNFPNLFGPNVEGGTYEM